jgi:K+-transporting ATPase A subunit
MKEESKDLLENSKECVILMELLSNIVLVKSIESLLLEIKKNLKQLKNVVEKQCLKALAVEQKSKLDFYRLRLFRGFFFAQNLLYFIYAKQNDLNSNPRPFPSFITKHICK